MELLDVRDLERHPARARTAGVARLGLILASLSIVALVIAGIAYAAGADPAGACGGG